MAAVKVDSVSVLKIEVVTGNNASGMAIHSTRTISDINPALADADFLDIGTKIGALQIHVVESVKRSDTSTLVAQG